MTVYDLGDPVVLDLAVQVDGAPAAPTTVSLTVTDPAGATATHTPTATSTGRYSHTVQPTLAGDYAYRWVTTGIGAGAETGTFYVLVPGEQLLSLEDARQATGAGPDDEQRLARLLKVVSDHLVRAYGVPRPGTATRSYEVHGGTAILPVGVTVTAVDGEALPYGASYQADSGLLYGLTGRRGVAVTYTAGVPAEVREAARIVLKHAWDGEDTAYPDAYGTAGGEPFTGYTGFFVPNRAKELLTGYRSWVS